MLNISKYFAQPVYLIANAKVLFIFMFFSPKLIFILLIRYIECIIKFRIKISTNDKATR